MVVCPLSIKQLISETSLSRLSIAVVKVRRSAPEQNKAKDLSLKAKAKDMAYCPRGQGHGLEDSNTGCV